MINLLMISIHMELQGDAMHDSSSVVGIYFSNGLKDTDEAPKFVNRLSKAILARSENCFIVQLKGTQLSDPPKLAIGVSDIICTYTAYKVNPSNHSFR